MAFKKGVSGNPQGRPKETEKDKIVKKLTKETWNDLSEKMMTCSKDELEDIIAKECPFEIEIFIRHMLSLGEKPDWHQYSKYLERRIGKVQDELKIDMPQPTIIHYADGTSLEMSAKKEDEEE